MKKLTGLQKPFKYIGAPAPRPQPPLPPRIGTTFALPDSGGSAEAPGVVRSELHHHAEERRGPAHGELLLLGQPDRRQLCAALRQPLSPCSP